MLNIPRLINCLDYFSTTRLLTLASRSLAFGAVCFFASLSATAFADSLESRVDAVFSDLDSTHSAGCAVAIIHAGKTVYTNGYGMANLDHNVPITPQTVFDIGSTSKQFTASAIALLALDGRLALDDDVRKYIPELLAYDKTITVRHLLNHTSGVRDYGALLTLSGVDDHDVFSYQDLVTLTARQKNLNFTPGDEHLYSNTGYILLAIIVKRVSGLAFGEFVEQRIFAPLGMSQSLVYEDRKRVIRNRSTGYSLDRDGSPHINHYWNFALGGDGQVYTTVGDLAIWDSNFYDPRVGGPEFLEMMHTRGELNNGEAIDYALGLYRGEYRGLKTVHHGGAWGGFRAQFIRVPEHRFSTVVLCNLASSGPDKRARELIDIYLEEHLAPKESQAVTEAVVVDPGVLASYEGQYQLEIGNLLTITSKDGALRLQAGDSPLMELVPLSSTDFDSADLGARISFSTGASGSATGLVAHMGKNQIAGTRIESYEPTPKELARLTGSYYSDELDSVWRIDAQDGNLMMSIGVNSKFELQLTAADTFAAEQFSGVFQSDTNGAVSGLVINAGRVKSLLAVRQR
jgi:CubicO group peptidase (beta-lactamase class C family)